MSAATDHQQAVDRAIELMRKDLTADLSVADLARTVGYTKWYFTRVFARITGTTPARYRADLRMAEACRLLATTDLHVSRVCTAVGYESIGTFGTRFKAYAGCSPTAYRRKTVGAA